MRPSKLIQNSTST